MKELPILPDKVRYIFCYNCETMVEYNYLALEEKDSNGEKYKEFNCRCGMKYGVKSGKESKTKLSALHDSLLVLKHQFQEIAINNAELAEEVEENNNNLISSLLFDQIKELSNIKGLIALDEVDTAYKEIEKQIEFLCKHTNVDYNENTSEELLDHEYEKYGEIRDRDVELDKKPIQKEKASKK